jgi:hypothetical protein
MAIPVFLSAGTLLLGGRVTSTLAAIEILAILARTEQFSPSAALSSYGPVGDTTHTGVEMLRGPERTSSLLDSSSSVRREVAKATT